MYMRNRLNNQVVNEVREHFPGRWLTTRNRRNIRLEEAPSRKARHAFTTPAPNRSENYLALAREFLKLTANAAK